MTVAFVASAVLIGLAVLVSLVSLTCLIIVISKMFQHDQPALGAATIFLTLCTGLGGLIAFVAGWVNARAWNIQRVMVVWSMCILASMVITVGLFVTLSTGAYTAFKDLDLESFEDFGPALDEPDYTITAEELAQEIAADPEAARQKYGGKVVHVTGSVKEMGGDPVDPYCSYIALSTGPSPTDKLVCMTQSEPWSEIAPGQTVTLGGIFPSFETGAAIQDCMVIEAGEGGPISVESQELADEVATNFDEARQSYNDFYLVVTGPAEISFKDDAPPELVFQTEGDIKIVARLASTQNEELLRQFGPKRIAKVAGRAWIQKGAVELNDSLLVTESSDMNKSEPGEASAEEMPAP